MTEPNATVEFLVRLKKIDKRGLTCRDVLVIYTIIHNPGCSGVELADKIGAGTHSNIVSNIRRLIRVGFMEDRRKEFKKAQPSSLHILPAGVEFWNELKP